MMFGTYRYLSEIRGERVLRFKTQQNLISSANIIIKDGKMALSAAERLKRFEDKERDDHDRREKEKAALLAQVAQEKKDEAERAKKERLAQEKAAKDAKMKKAKEDAAKKAAASSKAASGSKPLTAAGRKAQLAERVGKDVSTNFLNYEIC
jgi:hypothetical protein